MQAKPGVDHGPIHLINSGLIEQLQGLGWQVEFGGHHQFEEISSEDDPPIGRLRNPRLVSKVTKAVSETVAGHVQRGKLALTLGGDHSLVCHFPGWQGPCSHINQALGTISGTFR